ncbi:MAG: ABC transporter substrate-binding protein [Burkholderiales bacterium]|nr:ABC transporter substrate-binding protein [Burkholderiales bacterium]
MVSKRTFRKPRLPARLVAVSWRDLLLIGLPVLVVTAALAWLVIEFLQPAPPNTIRLLGGPDNSIYRSTAERYKQIIEARGVKVVVLPSRGSQDNLQQLADPKSQADAGFVQGGLTDGVDISRLVSLGSLFPQPLMVYYRHHQPVEILSQLRGKRLAIGPEGSGTRALSLKLLKANAMDGPPTVLLDLAGQEAADALVAGTIDVAFLTGDSATPAVMRALRQAKGVELMNFQQANGYVRRLPFLSRFTLPEGAIDLGGNYPPTTYRLVGPTVELVARDTLHPALSDLLIRAAQEMHGKAGLFRDAGEYPAPLERDFPISADAQRYYKSGAQFFYRHLPFWLASLMDRLLVVLLPLAVLIVPATRIVPALYSWRVRSRIYRWYGALISLERAMLKENSPEQREAVLARLDEIEDAVNGIKTPLSFADQLYVLREHIGWVRHRLTSGMSQRSERLAAVDRG